MANIGAKVMLLGAVLAVLGVTATTRGQVSTFCNGWRDIDPETGNPLTAQSVTQHVSWETDGAEHTTFELPGSVARDSKGRVYSEWHSRGSAPSIRKGTPQDPNVGKPLPNRIYSTTSILDCGGGKAIVIYPDLEIARVTEGPPRDPDRTSFFETLSYARRPSNAVFEDLGYKEIEGFPARGFRETVLGTQQDGEWNGKAIHVTEAWVSDDLAMTMLEIIRNLRSRYESRLRRSHVNRQEPDGSLFEIPAGYKINPPPEENLPSKANPKPNAQE